MKPLLTKTILIFLASISISNTRTYSQCFDFYGVTYEGGEYNAGTIFKTDGNGENFKVVMSFPIINEGSEPCAELCEADNGKLYAMARFGGAKNKGVIFEWDPLT